VNDEWRATGLAGVLVRRYPVHEDSRGSFAELWRESWTSGMDLRFRQANVSHSREGVLRAMHFHLRQTDFWIPLTGRAFVALTDLRSGLGGRASPPISETFVLEVGEAALIPAGVAHGFLAMEPMQLAYLVTTEYDGTDEHGFAWDDPEAAISWPTREPILSDRDRGNPSLAEALAAARGSSG
jgi:dTDP-4-dehydrorhamnose 3,5-epimerase